MTGSDFIRTVAASCKDAGDFDRVLNLLTDLLILLLLGGMLIQKEWSVSFSLSSPEIARFKRFAVLDFKEAHVTSESLNNLAGLEHVGMMLLTLCDVQDEDLSPLTKIGGIRILSLSHTEITDSAVDTIAAIPGLEWVDVSDTRVTQRGIARLRAARPSVKIEPLFRQSTRSSRQKG